MNAKINANLGKFFYDKIFYVNAKILCECEIIRIRILKFTIRFARDSQCRSQLSPLFPTFFKHIYFHQVMT